MAEIHGTESFKEVTSHVDGSGVKSSFTVETYDIYCIFVHIYDSIFIVYTMVYVYSILEAQRLLYAHHMYTICAVFLHT